MTTKPEPTARAEAVEASKVEKVDRTLGTSDTTEARRGTTATDHFEPNRPAQIFLGITRILVGFEFLWAFLDKLFGLHFSTAPAKSWLHGGSPVSGFLSGVTAPDSTNPFKGFFKFWLDNHAFTDWLFMLGLLAIGVTITFGIGIRLGAIAGAAMMLLMWLASFPIHANPFVDYHIVDLFLLLGLAAIGADRWIGLGRIWRRIVGERSILV